MNDDVKLDKDYEPPLQEKDKPQEFRHSHLFHVSTVMELSGDEITVSPASSHERKVPEWACQFCFDWHENRTHTHKQSFVLSLCVRRRWRGPILHSRVDRSLVYFIHFTWRDACLSWLAASLRFTRHCTRQTMRQFCSRPASSGESALDRCYCIRFQLKYH